MPNSFPPSPDRLWTHSLNLGLIHILVHSGSKRDQQWIWGLEFRVGPGGESTSTSTSTSSSSSSTRSLFLVWRRRPLHTDPARLRLWNQARTTRITYILKVSRWHYQNET